MHSRRLIPSVFFLTLCAHAQIAAPGIREWQDQQGRKINAALIRVEGENVVLQLEGGKQATVPLSRFSPGDQEFARQQGRKSAAPASTTSPAPTSSSKTMTWPPMVSINKKDLDITTGEQNAAERQFTYQSGSFQFVSQAPLTGTVMRDISSDFELTSALFRQLPWGWQPKPRGGKPFFLAKLYETEKDFIAGGGIDNSSGGSKDDYIFTKFSSLGLKKVGERYAFDAKLDRDGDMISLIVRLMIADMRGLSMPWSSIGLEQLLQHVAYRNGSYAFTSPERALKLRIEARRSGGYETDVKRLVALLKSPWSSAPAARSTSQRIEYNMDAMLLVYYFGFLDGEGQGAPLHQYYSAVAQDSLIFRTYNESGRQGPRPPWNNFEEHAVELNNKFIIAGRSDENLSEFIVNKFKSIGIKL